MSKVSNCCGAPPVGASEDMGLCPDCKDHCEYVEEYDDDEPSFPRNPMLIHRIQDELAKVSDRTIFGVAIVASKDTKACIDMISDQIHLGNRVTVIDCVGETLVTLVEEYTA